MSLRADFLLAERTGVLLFKAGLLVQEEAERAFQAAGSSLRTFMVLSALAGQAELSQQDLSQVLNLDPTTVVALIDELEKAGQVERQRNPADRRRYILRLTDRGREARAAVEEVATATEQAFFARLEPGERELLHGMLDRLLDGRWPQAVCD
ncbi:MarR family winged helix-turn-helix transcriptional regulator [Kitasatospora viridis]|uniref:DNA-binding MarR family transcriptional regulator n=1 Tax=Kitasatospora viridis TaxID=281105 RepID=A0A561UFX8_9ACTN|nr:MarR family transcriptional regulator [Kitasatospora viridis]TWF98273.1 DNA-binding MarR family transcriptional regulator [Kitasatospora viridis]